VFTLKNDKGQSVSLSDFKGKVVYIDFWGVGCGPCIYDIKNHVPKLHEHYKNKDVVFLNICVDSKDKEWKEALEKHKLDGVNMIAEGWTNHPVCKAYNVSGIPHYILIDKNGKMVNNNAPAAYEFNLTSGKNEIDLLLK
jgi:thiol-disulfide isomerase/thioredoxin